MPGRVYVPGFRIGLRELVLRLPRTGHNEQWLARCLGCGRETTCGPGQLAAQVRAGRSGRCSTCSYALRRRRRKCLCGELDPKKFAPGSASTCMACHRAGCRNGRCECGRAIRKKVAGGVATVIPCVCAV